MRRRPDAAGRQAARRHGPRPTSSPRYHRYHGLRATGMGHELELEWPEHPDLPAARLRRAPARPRPDRRRQRRRRPGRRVLEGHEAVAPARRARLRARRDRAATADGVDRRRPRRVTRRRRRRQQPLRPGARHVPRPRVALRHGDPHVLGVAAHDEPWIESALDVKDRNGNPMPGYGWIFPVGDGTVNIGVGLLSTFRDFKSVNTTHLLDGYAHQIADRWEIDPDTPECRPSSGRMPMGGSVGPKAGPDVPRRRRRRRRGQPVQRRGHRLRLRDRRAWPPT